MRIALAGAALFLTSGCALIGPTNQQANRAQEPARAVAYGDGELQPASLAAPRRATGAPIGLTPCKKRSFPAQDCWRRGDQHVLFPPSIATAGMPTATESIAISEKR